MSVLNFLIVLLVTLLIISILIPKILKFVLVLGFIYLIFHVGYVWNYQETEDNLKISSWMSDDKTKEFEKYYTGFTDKRDSKENIVDTKSVGKMMDISIAEAKRQLEEPSPVMKEKIAKQWTIFYKGLTKEEAKELTESTKAKWKNLFTEEEMNDIVDYSMKSS